MTLQSKSPSDDTAIERIAVRMSRPATSSVLPSPEVALERPRPRRISVTLRREGGEWKIASADWQRASISDFVG